MKKWFCTNAKHVEDIIELEAECEKLQCLSCSTGLTLQLAVLGILRVMYELYPAQ
jgi:hypothetical protein